MFRINAPFQGGHLLEGAFIFKNSQKGGLLFEGEFKRSITVYIYIYTIKVKHKITKLIQLMKTFKNYLWF